MRLPAPRRSAAAAEMLPILNVILLLLAFFVMLARIGVPAPAADLPHSSAPASADASTPLLQLDAQGVLRADGAVIEDGQLAAWCARSAAARLRLQAHARAPAMRVLAVLALLQAGGADRVQLLVAPAP